MKKIFVPAAIALAVVCANSYAEPVHVDVLGATVKDQRIDGATVTLQRNGEQSVTSSTNASGQAILTSSFPDDKDALLIVKKEGYSNLVAQCPCAGMTYAISPVMTNLDGMRVVLTWAKFPADLDSHLMFPGGHVYFVNKKGQDANLDVDDTDSYGPETITISKKHFGESYTYAVVDYSHKGQPTRKMLSESKARVFVYVGSSLVRTYSVPVGMAGNIWTVFKLNPNGEFEDINSITGNDFNTMGRDVNDLAAIIAEANSHAVPVVLEDGNVMLAKEYNRDGEAYYKAGELENAIQAFQQATEADNGYGQAFSNLGLVYQKDGKIAEAIWANRKAISLASGANAATTRANSYYNIAKIYENAGQYAEALQHYQLANVQKNKPVYENAITRVKDKI